MGAGVEMPVESDRPAAAGGARRSQVRLLGPLTISRDGVALALPASRKVRALFAYLSLAPHAVTRSQLCELLWDVPNDPRGELRWCLSKVRSIVDEPGRRRVDTPRRHRQARPGGLLRRCDRDRPRDPGRASRRSPPERLRTLCRAVRRRLSRRPGDRPQPGLQRLAHRAAAPLPRLPRRPAGASRRERSRRRGVRISGEVARSLRRSTGASTRSC